MATGSYMTPIYSRSQSEVLGDLHMVRVAKYHHVMSRRSFLDLDLELADLDPLHRRLRLFRPQSLYTRYRTVACFVTGSSPVPLKTRRVGQRCTLNLSRAETSSRWCGVVVRRGGASSGVVHVT
ncbi:uncharacterized protein TNCV_3804991 [Trichonephila clavipes]|nr:uncharacterized protein TNCV_3804991 [Trichonephila clavipes]